MSHHLMRCMALLFLASSLARADLYVSPTGNDANAGTQDKPFQTLERARKEVRQLLKQPLAPSSPVTVWLTEGKYHERFHLERMFELTREDSGTQAAPVIYRGAPGQEVRVSGGRRVWCQAVKLVRDPAVIGRLDPAARGKVMQADLRALGVDNLGEVPPSGKRAEVYFNDRPLTMARWPNEGFVKIADVAGGEPMTEHGIKGDRLGRFTVDGDRPGRWKDEKDVWLHGYWFWDWSEQYQKVEAISVGPAEAGTTHAKAGMTTIALAKPYHHYGYRKGQPFYAVNLLAELDSPGEWYLDRQTGILYFWPPGPMPRTCVDFSVLESPLISLKDVSHVVLRDLVLECGRGDGVRVEGGEGDLVAGCILRNLGGTAVVVNGGRQNGVAGCNIYQTGGGGISVSGGDRRTLTPAGNFALNNHIHHFALTKRTYAPAIQLGGVGNRAAHNLIHDAPHMAVGFGGNENVMELNDIHDVCQETGDVGVFYTGRDWTVRGNVIRHNFIHHVHGPGLYGAQGIYLDDCASGTIVFGNVLCEVARAMLIGGGRDNAIENNLIVDCKESVCFDNRGLNWMKDTVEAGGSMPKLLAEIPYRQPPWSQRYPQLLTVLDDNRGAPKGNVIRWNAICRSPAMNLAKEVTQYGTVAENPVFEAPTIAAASPQRADARETVSPLLRDDSPIFRKLPGFQKIPLKTIGLQKDEYRKELPGAKGPALKQNPLEFKPLVRPGDAAPRPPHWEKDILAFEAADKKAPPPQGAVLFIGSSGIALWKTLAQDFPEHKVINRGFGGSQIVDSVYYADRIVIPYKPRLIVLRAGTNDINAGKTPARVFADFKAFVEKVHAALPETRIVFMSLGPSPARWANVEKERMANQLIREYIASHKNLDYIDAFKPMLGPDGRPRSELFAEDHLHCNAEGYKLWVSLVRPHLK
jgi:lysophospholipase L1-like esterase